jgi:hypothetical protein
MAPVWSDDAAKEAGVAKKNLGNTVLGWFVVKEGEEDGEPEETEDEPEPAPVPQKQATPQMKRRAAPPLPSDDAAPPSVRLPGNVPQVAAGAETGPKVFTQVFQAAHITDEAQGRVEKALALLQSLPTETPRETRKQIVEASLKAFAIPLDSIIETAAEEIQALEAFIQHGERHTQSVLLDANAQIEKLAGQISEIKKLMELQIRTQQGVVRSSNEQKLRVQQVLEFFGQEAVARVVEQSPKLVVPQ